MANNSGWRLKSGRWVNLPKGCGCSVFIEMAFASELCVPVTDGVQDENDRVFFDAHDDDPLTDDERKEFAEWVKKAWDHWAKTGKP